ncbi:flagellar FlbD family protein [Jeotgalibacillus terrae]|uniref:Flagellar FlbD family protein n=1 Tax=Jeotgalibacillus terrae TaxID=587735 RepID=A0ABW5ZMW4_9BACL|nr:flagellar FlbD family protein [Jeotgalibacillus terrae]MBM7579864.1 flagellar protein FlbD [Jeotgalibacillus terrae]
MIYVKRLNGKEFMINAIYIETVEAFPDTTITLTNGKKYIVQDSMADVKSKITDFYRSIHVLNMTHLREDDADEE